MGMAKRRYWRRERSTYIQYREARSGGSSEQYKLNCLFIDDGRCLLRGASSKQFARALRARSLGRLRKHSVGGSEPFVIGGSTSGPGRELGPATPCEENRSRRYARRDK